MELFEDIRDVAQHLHNLGIKENVPVKLAVSADGRSLALQVRQSFVHIEKNRGKFFESKQAPFLAPNGLQTQVASVNRVERTPAEIIARAENLIRTGR